MPNVEKFVVNCKADRFTVKAFASGMTSGLGHNPTIGIRDFEGETQFVPDTFENASLTMKIRAASLTVEDEMNREDRTGTDREQPSAVHFMISRSCLPEHSGARCEAGREPGTNLTERETASQPKTAVQLDFLRNLNKGKGLRTPKASPPNGVKPSAT